MYAVISRVCVSRQWKHLATQRQTSFTLTEIIKPSEHTHTYTHDAEAHTHTHTQTVNSGKRLDCAGTGPPQTPTVTAVLYSLTMTLGSRQSQNLFHSDFSSIKIMMQT